MSDKLDKVIAALKHLGFEPDIDQYSWRFIIQKMTYLAQVLGMDIGYEFSMYVAGPYSRELTCNYYVRQEQVNSLQSDYNLTKEEIEVLDKIKECCNFEEPSVLESTSTIAYFLKQNQNLTDGELFEKTRTLKPYLSEYTCITGLNKAKELFFKSSYLTDELEKELKQWDESSD